MFPDPKEQQANPRAVQSLAEDLKRQMKQPGVVYRGWRILCMTVLVAGAVGIVAGYFWLDDLGVFSIDRSVLGPAFSKIPSDNSIVFDRDGKKIGEYFDRYHIFVPYKGLPKNLVNAIIAIEDRNFFNHHGIDPRGILRAARAFVKEGGPRQGASTITQQLVRHFLLTREKTLGRKAREMMFAIHLERELSKKKIIELYSNTLFLGSGSYGVGAAAKRYFGKKIGQLGLHELALIAGLFQSPSKYNPHRFPARAKKRQKQVLTAMYSAGLVGRKTVKKAMKEPLVYKKYHSINATIAPYFVDYIRERTQKIIGGRVENRGLRIYTTLDSKLQEAAAETFEKASHHFSVVDKKIVPIRSDKNTTFDPHTEAALLSVDPGTGDILAMLGGRDYRKSQYNRAVHAMRSPGSAFKPIVYALALQSGWKWSDLLFVSPISIDGYRPKNYDSAFLTETTLLRAFYKSLNTATVELGTKIGLSYVVDYAKRLGIRTPLKGEAGTLLGSSELSMPDLARAYSVFANSGRLAEQVAIKKITDRAGKVLYRAPKLEKRTKRVIPPQIAWLITEGMRTVLIHGTGATSWELSGQVVGKTGTSNNSEDNWFCGYSPNLLTVVWAGTDNHLPMVGRASGSTIALPLWDMYMRRALKRRPPTPVKQPEGITTAQVHARYGHRNDNGVVMYFLKGQEPTRTYSEYEVLGHRENFRSLFNNH